jgi:threonine synthase
MDCVVLLPAGKIAKGKLAQALVYGAKVVTIDGNFDEALRLVREIGGRDDFEIVNSINPYRLEGQKTAAFEIVEVLGDAPHFHVLPVGNAGNITAYWKGYGEFRDLGRTTRSPKMLGFQATGAAPLVLGHAVENPDTVATAIRIGNPASWEGAMAAVRESGGAIDMVTDEEILEAQRWLAAHEGIFVEPASAASIAGLLKYADAARRCESCPLLQMEEGSMIVCTATGNGLKDVDVILSAEFPVYETAARTGAVLAVLGIGA